MADTFNNLNDKTIEGLVDASILPKINSQENVPNREEILSLMRGYKGRHADAISIIMYAAEKGKIREYFDKLKNFLDKDLKYVHPEARRVACVPGALRAEAFFLNCYKELGIKRQED